MLPQLINTALGIWMMAAPGVLGYGRPSSSSDHIVGTLVATFACIAIWEATRPIRWINVPFGIWIAVSAWILGHPPTGQLNNVLCGTAIAALSCAGGAVQQRFGGGWSMLCCRCQDVVRN